MNARAVVPVLLVVIAFLLSVRSAIAGESFLPDVAIPSSVVARPLLEAPRAAQDAEGNYVVDLLVLYTPLAESRLSGRKAVHGMAEHLVASANQYYVNSLMPVRYRLVGVEESSAASERDDYFTNQADLAANAGVRKLRNRVGGDLVILIRSNDASNFCGLGGLFNGGEQTDPPANVDPERDAFAVFGGAPSADGVACADVEHLFAHELGHCMGGGHQYLVFGVQVREGNRVILADYWKPYAHATYCGLSSAGTRNNTIMMGGLGVQGVYAQGGDLRGDYFSSPALTVDGLPCGAAPSGIAEGETDNARSISEAAPYVAAYRESKVAERGVLVAGGLAWSELLVALLGAGVGRRVRSGR